MKGGDHRHGRRRGRRRNHSVQKRVTSERRLHDELSARGLDLPVTSSQPCTPVHDADCRLLAASYHTCCRFEFVAVTLICSGSANNGDEGRTGYTDSGIVRWCCAVTMHQDEKSAEQAAVRYDAAAAAPAAVHYNRSDTA